jgi:NAD-dependent DNA ligase
MECALPSQVIFTHSFISDDSSGSLSVVRAEFENFIKNNGGTVAKSVTNSVTHLVR